MRIVSPFLKKVLYPMLSSGGTFRRMTASGLAVVTYHGVLPRGYQSVDAALDGNLVDAEMLRSQLRLLKAHYVVITPEDALAWREGRGLPPRAVLLTCDDGLLNCLTDMLSILLEEQVKCLFFVTGASAAESRTMLWYEELFLLLLRAPNGPFEISSDGITIEGDFRSRDERRALWWKSVKRLSQASAETRESFLRSARSQLRLEDLPELNRENQAASRRFGLLTAAEIRQLAAAGMTIGAHTLSHPMLSQLPMQLAEAELSGSKKRLESVLQERVWALAYPFGNPESVTPQVLSMAQGAGYAAAFLNFGGGLGVDLPAFALPRVHVTSEMSLPEFEAHVSGFYSWLHGRVRQNRPGVGVGARVGGE